MLAGCVAAEIAAATALILPDSAALSALQLGPENFALSGQGGFRVFDATNDVAVPLGRGLVVRGNNGSLFTATGDGVRLHAQFESAGDHVVVRGEIENLKGDERGFRIDYRLPAPGKEATFSNELDEELALAGAASREGNVFPIATIAGGGKGLAMAIPPDQPRSFGMLGDAEGLAVRFYLGTSPKPLRFSNRAPFEFVIYAADARHGFRGALARYYALYPDYYRARLKKEGIFMFQMEDRKPANLDQYGWNLSETQWAPAALRAAIQRDEAAGIETFPYSIVGQREIKFLPALPKNYDEAMAIFNKWTIADHRGHPLTKENVCCDGDIHLKEEVESSAVGNREGHYSIVVRDTLWGNKSVTFKTNPSPDLFADTGRLTVGSYAMEVLDRWLKEYPEYDGIFVDSMGANWPAVLNYRPDHFVYARYPLTFDPWGRVAIHNEISHYEYIETMRAKLHPSGRLILSNGVYAYNSRGKKEPAKPGPGVEFQNVSTMFNEFVATVAPPEHYRAGTRVGRFFSAALMDVASSEFGIKATDQQCRDVRVFMGHKPYAFLNYYWDDQAKIDEFVNRCLGYGIYASTSTNFFSGVRYEDHPQGYARDKALLDWYVPLVRALSSAGWEPVRNAAFKGDSVSCERFGSGSIIYYSLHNDTDSLQACELTPDLAALGLKPGSVSVTEIARQTPLSPAADGRITLTLAPKKAYVIQVSAK